MAMPSNRWVDKTQPQTLMMATILMYINAALSLLLGGALFNPIFLVLLVVGPVAGGWGIANEKKWGYWLGLTVTILAAALFIWNFRYVSLLTLIFYVALVALLLHPESRSYRHTWFR